MLPIHLLEVMVGGLLSVNPFPVMTTMARFLLLLISGLFVTVVSMPLMRKRPAALVRSAGVLQKTQSIITLPGLTALEAAAVKIPTLTIYSLTIRNFYFWALAESKNWETIEELDRIVCFYLNQLALDGVGKATGNFIVAAICFFIPMATSSTMIRSLRAMKGWAKLQPGKQRLPFPLVVLLAVVAHLLSKSKLASALGLLISFRCYLRPGEFQKLTTDMIVKASVNGVMLYGLLLHPSDEGQCSKIGESDEAIYWDTDAWMTTFFDLMLQAPAGQQLLNLAPGILKSDFLEICELLHLMSSEPCLYMLRHGGASHDLTNKLRPASEVKRRGRWVSDKSLKRYGKETRLLQMISKTRQSILNLGQLMESNLGQAFMNPHCIPRNLLVASKVNARE